MSEVSRRGFLRTALVGIAGTGLVRDATAQDDPELAVEPAVVTPPEVTAPAATDAVDVAFTINGEAKSLTVHADDVALHSVRRGCGLTGAKLGCGAGTCGACTVMIDGVPQVTCLLPSTALHGAEVTTVEALGGDHPVQRAFLVHDALQCGYCTPGFVVEAAAFHDRWRAEQGTAEPDRDAIAAALAGHLCRCGAYVGIYAAVAAACRGEHDDPSAPLPFSRPDGQAKASGEAVYSVDVVLPGMLEGRFVRSTIAHGVLTGFDDAAARAMPGVEAVHRLIADGGTIRYAGQELAAVAAVDVRTAEAAVAAIVVSVDPLPVIVTVDQAKAASAPVIYEAKKQRKTAPSAAEGPLLPAGWDGNVRGPLSSSMFGKPRRGRKGIDEAAKGGHVAGGTYTTQVQCHTALEPHGCVAHFPTPDTLVVHGSTQSCHDLAEDLAHRFDLKRDAVQVLCPFVGGGFGAKVGLQIEQYTCVELARQAGAPVRLFNTREEELTTGGLRPGQVIELTLGASPNGDLLGMSHQAITNAGVSVGNVTGMLARIMYPTGAKDLDDFDIVTNGPPGKPMRGPGGPPTYFALEQAIDDMALQQQIDPIALRRSWDPNPRRQLLYDWAEALPIWRDRGPVAHDTGRLRRGVGLAAGAWFYFHDPSAQLELTAGPDGLVARCASQDMGNGTRSMVAWAVSQALDVPPEDVTVELGDSSATYGPLSAGSRTTASLAPAAEHAAEQLSEALSELAEDLGLPADAPWRDIVAGQKPITVVGRRKKDDAPSLLPFPIDHLKVGKQIPGVVNLCHLEVDTRLGRVQVLESWVGVGVGRIVCPPVARSQMEGATVQAISYALYEERVLDSRTGRLLTHNLDDYRMAGIGDLGPVHVHFEERGFEGIRGGAIGLGELGSVAAPAAIANAFHHATGVRAMQLPLKPRSVLEVLA